MASETRHDDHHSLLRDSVRDFVEREHERQRARTQRGKVAIDRIHWTKLAGLGCLGATIPARHGGLGLELGDQCAVLEELGAGLLPEPVCMVTLGAAGLLSGLPDAPLAAELLPAIASGALLPMLAWLEGDDSHPGFGAARLRRCEGRWLLTGGKRFVVPADGDGFLVSAMSDLGPAMCWVPRDAAGVVVSTEMRIDQTACARAIFQEAEIIPSHCIAGAPQPVAAALQAAADACVVGQTAELLGVAEAAFATTLDYLRVRRQFGKPIGAFQSLQHRAVDLYAAKSLARAALEDVLREWPQAAPVRRTALASRVKARAADSALSICREAVQMHGAIGFADECDVGLYLKRALVLSAMLGNAAAHRARYQFADARQPAPPPRHAPIETQCDCDWADMPEEEFRLRVRDVFERHYPAELRNPPRRLRWVECRDFYRHLGSLGLLALAWPKSFGGSGLSSRKQLIFMQEQDRWGVARAPDMGITMVGPGLIRFGTPEQQRRYLPAILSFEHMWCQGFSEPDAGSDLASLRTRAVRDGDQFVIDGAKIWTTFAQDATHMFLLARTGPEGARQAGISVFLVDLSLPGITVRPIRDIAGNEEFCEVRFDAVRVSAGELLGNEDEGWSVAKMLLARERIYLGNPRQPQYALKRVDDIVERLGLDRDPVLMARLTALRLDVIDLVSLFERFAEQVSRGQEPGPEVSILKLFGSETYQRLSELAIELLGPSGALLGSVPVGDSSDDVMSLFINSRPATIYGGSSEVQRDVLAKQVLHLPKG